MNDIEKFEPAFPCASEITGHSSGMSLREYAAIHLKVPNSGVDWLDEMIKVSLLNQSAAHALSGAMANPNGGSNTSRDFAHWANECAKATVNKTGNN